ncbi:MAG: transketolase [Oscillospiraceae bacterium]|nr:transketolase [Oscillospiraceae bacterium]
METSIINLSKIAKTIREDIIKMVTEANSGHPGGSLSSVEILVSLYFNKMNVDPKNPKDPNRDRFVLSKGHASPLLYSVLACRGFFSEDELLTFRKINSRLQGHPNMNEVPGVDMSTGSLGQGISAAVGMALAGKIDKKGYKVFALLGDGECEEGEVWEASMAAAQYKLDNLIAFLDFNGLQIDGDITKVMNPEPFPDKFRAFNWNVIEVENGNDFNEVLDAIDLAYKSKGKPTMIVCKTVKGKGVSFMENEAKWHGTAPTKEQCEKAILELEEK